MKWIRQSRHAPQPARSPLPFLALLLGLAAEPAAQATDRYVATNGNDTSHGSWSTAYTNVQDALNAAANGDTLYLAGHTFALTNQLVWAGKTNMAIRGGYAATNDTDQPGTPDTALWPTLLTRLPGYTNRILRVANVTTGTLERVTLTGGYVVTNGNAYGGAMYIVGSTGLVLSTCVVTNNTAYDLSSSSGESRGGGIYSISSVVALSNCLVRGNTAFQGNSYGGGINIASGSMTLRDSIVANNESYSAFTRWGGGIYCAGTCVMRNCLVAGNSASGGNAGCSGLYLASGVLAIENCTIADNTGQGINRANGTATVTNSIIWGNGADVVGVVTLGWSGSGNGVTNGVNGCLTADPLFERGYYLATNSPCLGAGSNIASILYLTNYTTRASGLLDTNANVTMGYHYSAGFDYSPGDLYVATNGDNDANSGTNPASPFRTITKAFSAARDGSVIHVGAGTYTNGSETFPLSMRYLSGVQILGTNRATTVISAAGTTNRVMTLSLCNNMIFSGMTITGGNLTRSGSTYGGGVYLSNCGSIVFSDCAVTNNRLVNLSQPSGTGSGAGIYSASSVVTLTNCLVKGNANNGGNARGGGISIAAGILTLCDSLVLNNTSVTTYDKYGGGIYNAGTCLMRNCLVAGNVAPGGGSGLYSISGALALENCTVANNAGQGIYRGTGTATVTNSIIWGNAVDIVGAVTMGWSDSGNGVTPGVDGCLNADPLFAQGYYLAPGSPCVDSGTNTAADWGLEHRTTRTDGSNDSGRVDLGYHYPSGYDSAYSDVYVATNGNDGNVGTNAASPFRTITRALAVVCEGTRVHVGSGTYTNGSETLPLSMSYLSGVQILGTNRATTVISAAGTTNRVMTLSLCNNMVLSGLTITGGNMTRSGHTYGGGVYLAGCGGIVFADCAITNNRLVNLTQASGDGYGGGLFSDSSVVTLSNCLVRGNSNNGGNARGGGIYVASGTMTLRDSIISTNSSVTTYTKLGGGIANGGGTCRLRNCLVAENLAPGGGAGLHGAFGLENCTVANNAGQGINGSGTMTNSIIWGNGDDLVTAMAVRYCDIQSSDTFWTNGINGCISDDPLFVNTSLADYRLTRTSPCVNLGVNDDWMAGALDLDGTPRLKGPRVDMGAYECQATVGTLFVVM